MLFSLIMEMLPNSLKNWHLEVIISFVFCICKILLVVPTISKRQWIQWNELGYFCLKKISKTVLQKKTIFVPKPLVVGKG